MKKYALDIILLFLLSLLLPLFFFKLDVSSLTSFDEAWYGSIAKNILATGDPIHLEFNESPYTDHPPFGFLLIALSINFFGASSFAVRLVPATLGFLSLVFLYLLGKKLFNKVVGFTSAVALSSTYWFLFRARSGNLDVILTFLFILTMYLAVKSLKNQKFLIPFAVSLSALFLTKSIVPFTIVPPLLVFFWGKDKKFYQKCVKPCTIFCILVGGWFISQVIYSSGFISHYLKIGLPGVGKKTDLQSNLLLIKEYLHNGIGKWFWPGVFSSLIVGIIDRKKYAFLTIFFVSFFVPFAFSEKGHIWHLIPLYPFMLLSFFGVAYTISKKFSNQLIASFFILIICFYVSQIQLKRMWYEFVDVPVYTSDEEILASESKRYDGKLYIDGDFVPAAAFYSEKEVGQIHADGLKQVFEKTEPLTLITTEERLTSAGILPELYEIIKKDRDKVLLMPIR